MLRFVAGRWRLLVLQSALQFVVEEDHFARVANLGALAYGIQDEGDAPIERGQVFLGQNRISRQRIARQRTSHQIAQSLVRIFSVVKVQQALQRGRSHHAALLDWRQDRGLVVAGLTESVQAEKTSGLLKCDQQRVQSF